MAGRCDRLQINDLKELLRKISQWSQWAIDVTPQSSERARLVTREERWFFERHFGNYDVGNRNSVRQRFELLQSEVDHSPGGRFRWIPGRGKAKLRCHAQTEYLCADPEQWSQQDPYLARVGQIVLCPPFFAEAAFPDTLISHRSNRIRTLLRLLLNVPLISAGLPLFVNNNLLGATQNVNNFVDFVSALSIIHEDDDVVAAFL